MSDLTGIAIGYWYCCGSIVCSASVRQAFGKQAFSKQAFCLWRCAITTGKKMWRGAAAAPGALASAPSSADASAQKGIYKCPASVRRAFRWSAPYR